MLGRGESRGDRREIFRRKKGDEREGKRYVKGCSESGTRARVWQDEECVRY